LPRSGLCWNIFTGFATKHPANINYQRIPNSIAYSKYSTFSKARSRKDRNANAVPNSAAKSASNGAANSTANYSDAAANNGPTEMPKRYDAL